jgi:uncharacterized SAM-binding protein YcdF (DUF218 family)
LCWDANIWGDSPSDTLLIQAAKSFEVFKNGYADYIIVSGGQGVMKDITNPRDDIEWLKKNGVDGNKIIEETKATSTFENLKVLTKIMKKEILRQL